MLTTFRLGEITVNVISVTDDFVCPLIDIVSEPSDAIAEIDIPVVWANASCWIEVIEIIDKTITINVIDVTELLKFILNWKRLLGIYIHF